MTIETVLNWLTEHAMRYNQTNLLSLLSQSFQSHVPHEVTFPNKEWLLILVVLDKLLVYRRKKQRKNVAIDQSLKGCEFWRRFQKLLASVVREAKNYPFVIAKSIRFVEFIGQIKLIEVMKYNYRIVRKKKDITEYYLKMKLEK